MDPPSFENHNDSQKSFWKKRRNLVALMVSLGFFNLYTLRVNLSVAIVAMTSSVDDAEGIAYPSINAVWSTWTPPAEIAKMSSFGISGSIIGMVVGYPVCGWLAKNYGWTYVFYVPGFVAVLWSIVWLAYIGDSPTEDTYISEEERKYIVNSIGPTDAVKTISFFSYPWKCIFTSMPVWAINCAHFCSNWGAYTLFMQLPSYMNDILKFDIGKGSILSTLPYVALTVVLQITGFLDFQIKRKNILTTTQTRKLFSTASFLSRTVFMYLAAYSTTAIESIVYLTLAMGLGGLYSAGFIVNHLDVAPQYASLLSGLSNTFGTIPGFVTPMLTGIIVQHKSAEEWKWVFIIASIVQLFGGIFYAIFATGERLNWAEIKPKEKECHIKTIEQ